MAVDLHDNRVTVTLGGGEFELVASKLAERYYGDRFRNDVEALGESNAYTTINVPTIGDDGNPVFDEDLNPVMHKEIIQLSYSGRLKFDIAVSSVSRVSSALEIPTQVVAAAWAMARAAGSTKLTYNDWEAWWLSLPSNAQDDLSLWEAVCVDLAERAFFRDYGGPHDAGEPDEEQEG